jgi:hypothetical protein
MASEIAPLPVSVLSGTVNFSGNTTLGSNIITGITSTSGIEVDMVVLGTGLSNGTVVTFVSDVAIMVNYAATSTNTGVNFVAGATSYTAEFIYDAVPQSLQDQDASNGYPLYLYIWNCVQMLDSQVNLLVRSAVGVNGIFDPNYINADGWSQILDINRCPTFALPWLAQFVGVSISPNTSLTKAQQIDQITNRSSLKRGMTGTIVNAIQTEINKTVVGTPVQTSQIIVLEQTKPYTVTFYGNTHGTTTIDGIPSTSSLSAGMYIFGSGIPLNTTIVSVSTNSIVISNPATATTNSVSISALTLNKYSIDQYSMTILIPGHYITQYTYQGLNASLSGVAYTQPYVPALSYNTVDTDINALGSNGYSNLILNAVPTSFSQFAPYIYKYRPAGVQVYIGAY